MNLLSLYSIKQTVNFGSGFHENSGLFTETGEQILFGVCLDIRFGNSGATGFVRLPDGSKPAI